MNDDTTLRLERIIDASPDRVFAAWTTREAMEAWYRDGDGAVAREYRVRATPTTIVIGRDGRLVARAAGTRDWDGKAGRAFLDALVAAPAK